MTHQLPPQEAPRDNPRPVVERLRKWPFVLLGGCAVVALAAVTIGPGLWKGEEQVAEAAPDMRVNQPRGLHGAASDYSQVEKAPAEEPKQEEKQAEQTVAQQYQQQQVQQQGGGGSNGPTRAEIRKAARMANLKTFPVSLEEEGQAAGGGEGGAMYSQNRLTDPLPCQVNAGTNIPAQMELRMTSETSGKATAITTRDVWSADKRCKAMPRGTRFFGTYDTQVREGQTRLAVLWVGLTRPPPRNDTIELEDTVAGEPDGSAGVKGDVNTHFWSKLGFVGAATILDLGKTAVTAGGEGGVGAAIAGVFANRASSPLEDWAKKKLDVPDVITTEPKAISIVLAQHIGMDDFRKAKKLR